MQPLTRGCQAPESLGANEKLDILPVFSCFQPPLPEEDYPPEDYPTADQRESYEDLLATGPSTLPKEYTFSHVSRTVIPRANLDRSTPAGWTLTVDPNGTWVFTSEHSPEQVAPRTD